MSAPFARQAISAPSGSAAPAAERSRIGRAEISELIKDARECHRLSEWERGFLASLADQVRRFGISTSLSEKQAEVFRRIEAKVYAT